MQLLQNFLHAHGLDETLSPRKKIDEYKKEFYSHLLYEELKDLYDENEMASHFFISLYKKNYITEDQLREYRNAVDTVYPEYSDVSAAKERFMQDTFGYELDQRLIDSYLARMGKENIQQGGSNAKGVFILSSGLDVRENELVAVVKSKENYLYEAALRSRMKDVDLPFLPKVIDVFVKGDMMYKIMQKSPGQQIDRLDNKILQNIPQQHYDEYIMRIAVTEQLGLIIDPSKPSNFFYDENIGFCFIDLSSQEDDNDWSMFHSHKSFNAHGILDNEKINVALKRYDGAIIREHTKDGLA